MSRNIFFFSNIEKQEGGRGDDCWSKKIMELKYLYMYICQNFYITVSDLPSSVINMLVVFFYAKVLQMNQNECFLFRQTI